MTASAVILASLLVGQAPLLEQPPVYSQSPAQVSQQPYEAAADGGADAGPAPVVVAGLGLPIPTAPQQRPIETPVAPPFANRSPAFAPVAPLAIPGVEEDTAPRQTWDSQPPRSRTVHTVEPVTPSTTQATSVNSSLAGALI